MKSVELFAGAGGLAMGVGLAGFEPFVVVERDRWACDTIRENRDRGYPLVKAWNVHEGDVREFDWTNTGEDIDLVAGGPPCQPFSMGGKHGAYGDERDMFPATVEIVRKLRPRAFLVENVKGLTRSSFANYYQYILLQLSFPGIVRHGRETWLDHFRRLQQEKASGNAIGKDIAYNVIPTLVNAADHGIPQRRERVFIVGFRSDLDVEWSFPRPTHDLDALLHDQWISGAYWERHDIRAPPVPEKFIPKIRGLSQDLFPPNMLPWRTTRDAMVGLPDPEVLAEQAISDHRFQPGARTYPGHTGSPLDLPAKTLKAGDHGVPGGENMLVRDDGSIRYFTIREAARLQTFPDG
ncbi:MAG: DNA cytosine methyltransferase, partial [Pseudomonadota bacterium]